MADKQPDFAPGTSWAYSDTNYVLAGMMIERATGHRLGSELQRRIFAPLHLRHTSFPVNASALPDGHANGYALVEGDLRDVTELNPSSTGRRATSSAAPPTSAASGAPCSVAGSSPRRSWPR